MNVSWFDLIGIGYAKRSYMIRVTSRGQNQKQNLTSTISLHYELMVNLWRISVGLQWYLSHAIVALSSVHGPLVNLMYRTILVCISWVKSWQHLVIVIQKCFDSSRVIHLSHVDIVYECFNCCISLHMDFI